MDYYPAIKHLHMTCAAFSGSLFLLRGYWMIQAPDKLQKRWVKTAPHIIDTLLLVSAITLAVISHQYPFVFPWLTAKLVALVLYIVLGTVALKRGPTLSVRVTAFLAAIVVFIYIVSVAVSKQALLF